MKKIVSMLMALCVVSVMFAESTNGKIGGILKGKSSRYR